MKDTARAKGVAPLAEDSLQKRYASKVGFNLLGIPMTWGLQALVPRALGPADYGSVSFVVSFFTTVINWFDMGTSTKLYNHLCQKPAELEVLRFYWGYVSRLAAAVIAAILLCQLVGARNWLWPDQQLSVIWLGAIYSVGMWMLAVSGRVVDAYGMTVRGEGARFLQKATALVLFAILFVTTAVTIESYFTVQFVVIGLLLLLWDRVLRRCGVGLWPRTSVSPVQRRVYVREFWTFSHPLLLGGLLVTLEGLADRWLLQYFGNSIEQGIYALSYQVGAVCFLFAGAAVPLVAREFSQAHASGDKNRMRDAFSSHVPRLYAISAFFGLLFASQAETVTYIFGGKQFAAAATPTLLMCLYPVHQTYGQLTASVFFATAQTALYRNIAIAGAVVGIACTYFMLAPAAAGGFGLGSTGLAIKMVAMQCLIVNAQLWRCCRLLGVPFRLHLASQATVLLLFTGAAGVAHLVLRPLTLPPLANFVVFAACYSAIAVMAIWLMPSVFGLSRVALCAYTTRAASLLRVRLGLKGGRAHGPDCNAG